MGHLLRNTPTDLYLLIARLALYEPARESRSINAAKNNSPSPGEVRERESEYEGSTRAEEVHWHRRARPFIYTDKAHY